MLVFLSCYFCIHTICDDDIAMMEVFLLPFCSWLWSVKSIRKLLLQIKSSQNDPIVIYESSIVWPTYAIRIGSEIYGIFYFAKCQNTKNITQPNAKWHQNLGRYVVLYERKLNVVFAHSQVSHRLNPIMSPNHFFVQLPVMWWECDVFFCSAFILWCGKEDNIWFSNWISASFSSHFPLYLHIDSLNIFMCGNKTNYGTTRRR